MIVLRFTRQEAVAAAEPAFAPPTSVGCSFFSRCPLHGASFFPESALVVDFCSCSLLGGFTEIFFRTLHKLDDPNKVVPDQHPMGASF